MIGTADNTGATPLVLVVEDEPTARLMAREALEGEGYRVVEAARGDEALRRFAEERPDIVLLDINMPGMDGFTACQRLRELPAGAEIPIVMMTGLDDIQSIRHAYELGATDFVTKPTNYLILTQRVRYILRATSNALALKRQEKQLAKAQRIAEFGHYRWDVDRRSIVLSPAAARIMCISTKRLIWDLESFSELAPARERARLRQRLSHCLDRLEPYQIEHRAIVRNGEERTWRHVAEVDYDECGRPCSLIGILQDVTARRRAEERVHSLAYFDSVTELPNRVLINEMLRHALFAAKRNDRSLAVLFCDLDNFKQVNDTLGHAVGDRLLRAVGKRLRECVRRNQKPPQLKFPEHAVATCDQTPDMVSRIGGDEFVVVLTDLRTSEDAMRVVERLRKTLARPISVGEHQITVSTSIGISVFPQDGNTVGVLLKNADAAMYHAKSRGRNFYEFFTESIKQRALKRFSLEADLRGALEGEELLLHYQPLVALDTGRMIGVEALARWRHPRRGMVGPAEFIPVAEETGLIVPMGAWIIRRACMQAARWQRMAPGLTVAVNLSPRQLREPGFLRQLRRMLQEIELSTAKLELEITENVLMEESEHNIELMRAIRESGVTLALDDFGTGFSSLSYLKRLPITTLKIDRSFVSDLSADAKDGVIATAMIALGHKLGFRVVAEGIETREQLQVLRREGCEVGQGYLFSRALPPRELEDWVRRKDGLLAIEPETIGTV